MASVSIAARDSLRVSTVSLVSSQDRSSAVRKVHFLPMRTRLTPRVAYSALSRASASRTSTPSGRRLRNVASSSGWPAANSKASSRRSSSARAASGGGAGAGSSLWTITSFLAAMGIESVSLCVFLRVIRHNTVASADTLAHIDRREGFLLMDFSLPLAYQLERGGEGRRKHRRRQGRLDHIRDDEFVDARPIRRLTYHPFERVARFGERPHRSLLEAHPRKRRMAALLRIGRQQIVKRRRIFRLLDLGDRLRQPARENVAIELRTAHQFAGHFAERFKTPEPISERKRHILGARAAFGRGLRQQQTRFEISEPGRHHQIVGGKLEPQLPRRLDESEVLVGKRQNGNFCEIDLLLPRQREQKVERTL